MGEAEDDEDIENIVTTTLIESRNIKSDTTDAAIILPNKKEQKDDSKHMKRNIIVSIPKKQKIKASPIARCNAAAAVVVANSDAARQSNELQDSTATLAASTTSTKTVVFADKAKRPSTSTRSSDNAEK